MDPVLEISVLQAKKQAARQENSFALTAPFPQTKKQVRFEDLEVESESESSKEANSPTRGDESDMEEDINLKCMKLIMRAYPKSLQPPWNYRTSLDKLKEFMNMSLQEKWAARKAFQKMPSTAKQSFFLEIRGHVCMCCEQPQRKDKGNKRGPNKATIWRSKRVAGNEPSTDSASE
jgi:hypothetical protein